MYALIQNDQFVRWVNLRAEYPDVSFPRNPTPEQLPAGVVSVATPNPDVDPGTFEVVETLPTPVLKDGQWTLAFQIRPMDADEIAAKKGEIKNRIVIDVQRHLDEFAWTRGYDNILSAATYVASTVPRFQAEGQYAVEARDNTWAKLYDILAEVEAGTRPMPLGFGDVVADLPALAWPN